MNIRKVTMYGIKWFIKDYISRHSNRWNAVLHLIGVPEVFWGIYQMICRRWYAGIINFLAGYLLQFIGHRYFQKNEAGELILFKKFFKKLR